jgi:PTH1 family peptidyl-tRNA hydrolase
MFLRGREAVSGIAVFLGNPGPRFDNTRHNAGFTVADVLSGRLGVKVNRIKFKSLTAIAPVGGNKVLLLKPQTYMNLSGGAVRQAMNFYKVPLESVVAVSDDVTLPPGKLRIRRSGSAGGHKGLQDIISRCGGEGFPRIKLGVGSPPREEYDMVDWVLSKLEGSDKKLIEESAERAASALEILITQGIEQAMSRFN